MNRRLNGLTDYRDFLSTASQSSTALPVGKRGWIRFVYRRDVMNHVSTRPPLYSYYAPMVLSESEFSGLENEENRIFIFIRYLMVAANEIVWIMD